MDIEILYEDKDIMVCVKKPGVPVQADKSRNKDMINILRNYVVESEYGYTKEQGIPYIGLVHRLDRPVGGVMVFAKTPLALKKLNAQLASGGINKRYYAITEDFSNKYEELVILNNEWIQLENYILKDGRNNISKVVLKEQKDAKRALLEYKALARVNGMVLNDIKLYTGRHHQIRVQMAYHKMPLIGDSKYNDGCKQGDVMLYSYSLEFRHPISCKNMLFKHIPTHGEFAYFKDIFKN